MKTGWVRTSPSLNDAPVLSNNTQTGRSLILYNQAHLPMVRYMKHRILPLALGLCLTATALPAQAACFADYKAKKDNPLKLHYGVMQLPDSACGSSRAAARVVAPRLQQAGWTLLNILSVFDETGLKGREANAGPYFLRF